MKQNNRLNPVLQHAMPTIQQYKRDLSTCTSMKYQPSIHWMCPSCEAHYSTDKMYTTQFHCTTCHWDGDYTDLRLGRT